MQSWTRSYKSSSEIIQYDNGASIGTLAKYSAAETIKFLAMKLRDTIHFWAVGRSTFDGDEGKLRIVELIKMIVEEYSWLKPSDVRIVFDNAKKGKYGETYNRMDGPLILSWFSKYATERIQAAEDISQKNHHNTKVGKTEDYDDRTPEQRTRDIERLKSIIGRMIKKCEPEPAKNIEPTPVQVHNYLSVEEYCEDKGIDAYEYLLKWESKHTADISIIADHLKMTYDQVYWIKRSHLLHQINHGIYE
jgi:hypothetical protein